MITSYEKLLESLVQTQVKFALVGGLAVCLNGFVRTTDDVDILIDNSSDNVARLSRVLADYSPWIGHHQLKSGIQIPFLKAAGLIETKRGSPREKDQVDIAALNDLTRARATQVAPSDFNLDSVRTPTDFID